MILLNMTIVDISIYNYDSEKYILALILYSFCIFYVLLIPLFVLVYLFYMLYKHYMKNSEYIEAYKIV